MSNTHPWCSDVLRDTAIRAAEDAAASERPPLPEHRDLPERVARLEAMIPKIVSASSAEAHENKGERMRSEQGGLRTERVTLEIKHARWYGVDEWSWKETLQIEGGESVRVVPSSEADAEVERLRQEVKALRLGADAFVESYSELKAERDAALARVSELETRSSFLSQHKEAYAYETPLDGWEIGSREWAESEPELHLVKLTAPEEKGNANGSEGDRAGTGCVRCVGAGEMGVLAGDARCGVKVNERPVAWLHEGLDSVFLFPNEELKSKCVPLFDAPPPPRGWLTEEEVGAVVRARTTCDGLADYAVLSSLLSRNSPPRVRLPDPPFARSNVAFGDWMMCIEAVKKSLAAAGVEVSE